MLPYLFFEEGLDGMEISKMSTAEAPHELFTLKEYIPKGNRERKSIYIFLDGKKSEGWMYLKKC